MRSVALGILGLATIGSAGAAETVTVTGIGTFVSTSSTLPLANGGAAIHLVNEISATMAPSESGAFYGDCAGLGYRDGEGQLSVRAYCTFEENDSDGFALEASMQGGSEGKVEIIGGRGKWAGASGNGTLKAKSNEGYGGSFDYEFRITRP
jgi:hypothetical protein